MLCGGVVVGVGAESVCAACRKFIIISPQTPTQLAAAATAAVAPHAPQLGLYKHSTYEVLLDKQRRAKDPLSSHSNSLTFPLAQSLSHVLSLLRFMERREKNCALWAMAAHDKSSGRDFPLGLRDRRSRVTAEKVFRCLQRTSRKQ